MRVSVLRRAWPPLLLALAAMGGGCTEVSTSPTAVASIAFDTLPFPAVVSGDTLRDSLGVVAPLHALTFNSAGAVIPDASIQYVPLDSGVTISAGGIVTAQGRSGSVRIVASADGLQSVTKTLQIARRPDSLVITGKAEDTLFYVVPDNATTNVSAGLSLQVATTDTAGAVTGTAGWLVSYQAFFHGQALAPTDTTVASIWGNAASVSAIDTTATDGSASRRLRVRPVGLPSAADSVIVLATVKYRGAQVRGSPVRFVIHTRPKPVS